MGAGPGAPIDAWIPVMLFSILFGLSIDYELFLMSRIREEWLASRNPADAIAGGLASTARVITAAAAIMICVFGAFALSDLRPLKIFGLGMAAAVLIDATCCDPLYRKAIRVSVHAPGGFPAGSRTVSSANHPRTWDPPSSASTAVPDAHPGLRKRTGSSASWRSVMTPNRRRRVSCPGNGYAYLQGPTTRLATAVVAPVVETPSASSPASSGANVPAPTFGRPPARHAGFRADLAPPAHAELRDRANATVDQRAG
jgi:hypothetical protein